MFALLVAAALASGSAKPGEVFAVPRQFWGEYNTKLADCGSSRNDSRLVIERNTLHFYESDGELREVIVLGPGQIVALMDFEGEGEKWTGMNRFTLSKDGKALVMTIPKSPELAQSNFTRLRCPGGQ